jgi:endonuclease-3
MNMAVQIGRVEDRQCDRNGPARGEEADERGESKAKEGSHSSSGGGLPAVGSQSRGASPVNVAAEARVAMEIESATMKPAKRKGQRARRETLPEKKARGRKIFQRLARAYPDAKTALGFSNPLELLVATILSAQTTDARVNMVTPSLFRKYKTAADYARAPAGVLEAEIRSTGFFNSKAKSLRRAGAAIAAEHGGRVPDTMEALVKLPGVGRKTANVVLGNAFGKDEGFVVDTHVGRLARRLGLTRETDPAKVENDLVAIVPEGRRALAAHQLILHGRKICLARRPKCDICPVLPLCPRVGVS